MTVEELRTAVETYRTGLEGKSGKLVKFSKSGPVGMEMIDVLVKTVEAQEKRIAALEKFHEDNPLRR